MNITKFTALTLPHIFCHLYFLRYFEIIILLSLSPLPSLRPKVRFPSPLPATLAVLSSHARLYTQCSTIPTVDIPFMSPPSHQRHHPLTPCLLTRPTSCFAPGISSLRHYIMWHQRADPPTASVNNEGGSSRTLSCGAPHHFRVPVISSIFSFSSLSSSSFPSPL